jgi:DNA-binding transcriptional ArsR family regulator
MRVSDPLALRALAHPIRLDLIEALGALGPTTAAECGRRLGLGQATCSFHLRQLERYGFVVRAEATGDARERPWRLVDVEQSWSAGDARAAHHLDRVVAQREADRRMAWIDRRAEESAEWRDTAFFGGASLPMTADELDDVSAQFRSVLEPYIERLSRRDRWPDGVRIVRFVLGATPTDVLDPDQPPDDHQHEENHTT